MERQNLISYLARLGINESPDTLPANLKTLTRLMAAHCRFVPFEVRVVFRANCCSFRANRLLLVEHVLPNQRVPNAGER